MAERRILNGWKEISAYMGRGVRTVQRWEQQLQLPVRRTGGEIRGAVMAFSDEIDGWLQRVSDRERPYVRPTILVLDPPQPNAVSSRKLVLETHKFNVLTAFTPAEVMATLANYNADAVLFDAEFDSGSGQELLAEIKESYPRVPVVVVMPEQKPGFEPADVVVRDKNPESALYELKKLLGDPFVQEAA